jgi:hypothetical protein
MYISIKFIDFPILFCIKNIQNFLNNYYKPEIKII